MDQFSLSSKVAIVTGGSRGIGEAIARTYAEAGAKVVLASRKIEGLNETADSIKATGGEATAIAAHMGDQAAVKQLVQRTVEIYGGVDIVVNNAATNPHFGPLLTSEESMWDKTLDVNLRGYFRLIGGKVINIASIAGLMPSPGMGLYGITKAAVIMMTRTLALELAPNNIQVNAIAPGFIKTKFSQALWDNDQLHDVIIGNTPAGRFADVSEITGIALYLASPASSFTTGQAIVVDGGLTLSPGNLES